MNLRIELELLDFWHVGYGESSGMLADAVVLRDQDGLPYLTGRALKGLFREAVQSLEDLGAASAPHGITRTLFGSEVLKDSSNSIAGCVSFSNAGPSPALASSLRSNPKWRASLFDSHASTAMKDGGCQEKSLRTIEVTLPVTLEAELNVPNKYESLFKDAAAMIRAIGAHRTRGLGRCVCGIFKTEDAPVKAPTSHAEDIREWDLEIELLNDLVLTADSATEGGHKCLDHIPGSAILGACLALKGDFSPEKAFGAAVWVSNAYPVSAEGKTSLPLPRILQLPKGKKLTETATECANPLQLKEVKPELRRIDDAAFFVPASGEALSPLRVYRMKTAIDRNDRRAKDGNLFGYEALEKGQRFRFRLQARPGGEDLAREWVEGMVNKGLRLGRSRSAEYSRVAVRLLSPASQDAASVQAGDMLVCYAASDLCLVRNDLPVTFPDAMLDLGLDGDWKSDPSASELRLRRYSPWNQFHGFRMAERLVIEKGSVWVYRRESGQPQEIPSRLQAGLHAHEGLGQIMLQPDFLLKPLSLRSSLPSTTTAPEIAVESSPLIERLNEITQNRETVDAAWALRSKWKEKLAKSGKNISASQWSTVRMLAQRHAKNIRELETALETFCCTTRRKRHWGKAYPQLKTMLAETGCSVEARTRALAFVARDLAREKPLDTEEENP